MEDTPSWIAGDESAAAMLARARLERPLLLLPPPLHRAPLRVGNVVEIAGPSPSAKSQVLLQAAIYCIIPTEWNGVHLGGLGRTVAYFDLDCRFDVLRLAQALRLRLASELIDSDQNTSQISYKGSQKYDALRPKNYPIDEELFLDCMRRFLYVRCYSSLEFLAALKGMLYRSRKESEAVDVGYFIMIDSIGAFYWMDRSCRAPRPDENHRKNLSLQSLTESVIDEMHKLLQVHPMLVLAAKATIFGSGNLQSCTKSRVSKRSLEDVADMGTYNKEFLGKHLYREYMPIVWQSFVTHRIYLQPSDGIVADCEHGKLPVYTSTWVQPPINLVDKFAVRDDGVVMLA